MFGSITIPTADDIFRSTLATAAATEEASTSNNTEVATTEEEVLETAIATASTSNNTEPLPAVNHTLGFPISWKSVNGVDKPLRLNAQGEVSCLGYINEGDGKVRCRTGDDVNAIITERKDTDYSELACGEDHRNAYGSYGYNDYDHWCSKGMRSLSKRDVDNYSFEGRKTCGDNILKEVDLPRKQVSGYCAQRIEEGASYGGTLDECMDTCHLDDNCTAISYDTQNNYCRLHSTQHCKNMTTDMRENTGVQQFTTYFKGDYRREQCKDHCDDDLNCSYFSLDDDKCKMYSLDTCTQVDSAGNELYKMSDNHKIRRELTALSNQNRTINEASTSLSNVLTGTYTDLTKTRQDLATVRTSLDTKTKGLGTSTTGLNTAKTTLATTTAGLDLTAFDLTTAKGQLEAERAASAAQLVELENVRADLVDKADFLRNTISNLKQTQENQSASNADLKAAADKILELNGELKSIETEIKTTNTQINNTKGDIETATTSINTANDNLSFLDGVVKSFKDFFDDFF